MTASCRRAGSTCSCSSNSSVPAGLAVITKADAVDPDWLALVQRGGGGVAGARPRVPFGEPHGGVGHDRPGHRRAARAAGPARVGLDRTRSRRPVPPADRSRVLGGRNRHRRGRHRHLRRDRGWKRSCGCCRAGLEARVRSIESHGAAARALHTGHADRRRAERRWSGRKCPAATCWCSPPTPGRRPPRLDAELSLSRDAGAALRDRTRVRVHHGTAEVMARVRLDAPLEPGRERDGAAQPRGAGRGPRR